MNLPIAVWMIRSFLIELPKEVLEAARVDGARCSTEMRRIILPMIAPGLAATALICFIFAWNEFFFAVSLTSTQAATVPVFLVGFITSEGLFWARLSAAVDHGRAAGDPRRLGRPEVAGARPVAGRGEVAARRG